MRRITLACTLVVLSQLLQGCNPAVVAGSAVAASAVASDRRPASVVLSDKGIEMRANDTLYSHVDIGGKIHVNINSFNQSVLLTGEAPSEEIRQQVEAMVRNIDGVKTIYNQIVVQPNSSADSRLNDVFLNSSIKGWILRRTNLDLGKLKIVTEHGNVYLMGLVTEEEANTAADIASRVEGVKEVIKVFEYISPDAVKPKAADKK